ncbi:MAG: poly-beta-1,6-N-acetyl-D-glucosamine N-deacetylase PgaB [Geovibrio sp.]|nr:poly-beta-1,6-N-acetyl-D-glucosamine N-deacetylase PgaB [Geovibrio sp.]
MKRIILLITFLLPAYLYAGSVTLLEKTRPLLNGVQVFVLDPAYEKNPGRFFDEVKKQGGNTVFFRVFHNSSDRYHFLKNSECVTGVYFQTDEACVVDDLLPVMIEEAHKRGIKLYAWMATRTLSFLKTPLLMEKTFADGQGTGEGYGASIFMSAVRRKLVRLFEDLAAYDIDGILFQDDFIMRHREGASLSALHAYYMDTGLMLTSGDLFGCLERENRTKVPGGCNDTYIPWAYWKAQKMADFFRELRQAVLVRNPSVRFAANIYYETPADSMKGISWYSQSVDMLLDAGFDYLAVMSYHDQIAREMKLDYEGAKEYVNGMLQNLVSNVDEKERILMKLQRVSWADKSGVDRGELEGICRLIDSYGSISKAIVPVNRSSEISGGCFR